MAKKYFGPLFFYQNFINIKSYNLYVLFEKIWNYRFLFVSLPKIKMRTIILPNRYGVENKLVQIGEKLWTIESEYPIRVCYTDNTREQICFIDVDGGYPIGSGTEIEGVVIESIKCEDNKIIIYEQ